MLSVISASWSDAPSFTPEIVFCSRGDEFPWRISFSNLQNADSSVIIHAQQNRETFSRIIYDRRGAWRSMNLLEGDSFKNLNGKNMVSKWA